jgi:hypothetical protein
MLQYAENSSKNVIPALMNIVTVTALPFQSGIKSAFEVCKIHVSTDCGYKHTLRFDVLMAVNMKVTVCPDLAPLCSV